MRAVRGMSAFHVVLLTVSAVVAVELAGVAALYALGTVDSNESSVLALSQDTSESQIIKDETNFTVTDETGETAQEPAAASEATTAETAGESMQEKGSAAAVTSARLIVVTTEPAGSPTATTARTTTRTTTRTDRKSVV